MDLQLSENSKQMAKSLLFILGLPLGIMLLFFVNVIEVNQQTNKLEKGHVSSITRSIDSIYGKYWYSELLPKRHTRAVAMIK